MRQLCDQELLGSSGAAARAGNQISLHRRSRSCSPWAVGALSSAPSTGGHWGCRHSWARQHGMQQQAQCSSQWKHQKPLQQQPGTTCHLNRGLVWKSHRATTLVAEMQLKHSGPASIWWYVWRRGVQACTGGTGTAAPSHSVCGSHNTCAQTGRQPRVCHRCHITGRAQEHGECWLEPAQHSGWHFWRR